MSERPEATGEHNQDLLSAKSFAQAHGLGEAETAYAIAAQGIELQVEAGLLNRNANAILFEARKLADNLGKRQRELTYYRERAGAKRRGENFTPQYIGQDLRLSLRQHQIMEMVAIGMTNEEIAEALRISPRTVEKHMGVVYLKTQTHRREDAIEKLAQLDLLIVPSNQNLSSNPSTT